MPTSKRVSYSKPLTPSIDEDYIDIDVNPTTFLCYQIHSSPEFEFNMSLKDKDSLTSPADELFYNGKLLPLHLPPRIQMVRKLLDACNDKKAFSISSQEVTPFESCNVTPSESCHVSGELTPDEHFYECTMSPLVNLNGAYGSSSSSSLKKGWSKRLKLIKNLSLSSKLKASKAYFKSLFGKTGSSESSSVKNSGRPTKEEILHTDNSAKKLTDSGSHFISKSGCSEGSSARNDFPSTKEAYLHSEISAEKLKDCLKNRSINPGKKNPFGQIYRHSRKSSGVEDIGHRKSFSGAIKVYSSSGTKSLPSSSSLSSPSEDSNVFNGLHVLKRSSSVKSDVESSIQGAIAYCKQSQFLCPRKSASEAGLFALAAAWTVAARETQEASGLYGG